MKQFTFKTQQFYFKQKIYIAQESVSFHLASNHSNYFNQMYFFIFYIPALTSVTHNAHGHYGKIRPRVLVNHSADIFTSSSQIIILFNNFNVYINSQLKCHQSVFCMLEGFDTHIRLLNVCLLTCLFAFFTHVITD